MKKIGVLVLVLLILFSVNFVLAAEPPATGFEGNDVEEILNFTDNHIPLDKETGKFDWGKLNGTKTKAEERIVEINFWLSSNAPWLSLLFGMVPEISWLFTWNFYFWMLFLVVLFLNGQVLFSFMPKPVYSRIFGLSMFIVLLVIKMYLMMARAATHVMGVIFKVILPWGLGISAALLIILLIFFPGILAYIPRLMVVLDKFMKARKLKEAYKNGEIDLETLKKAAEALRGGS